ncbi:ABC transporter ATP-binding protein [Brenneria roseae subsp. americana]|uniref:ABC transporter ATP-binding protein n=1 Tax=Brenneria roseae subsp. americana TaxID=1508507 RepID=A0A2U1TYB6_9GAMM|nr:oligopeptide/dipeptide ABC transporter ATP-binding protein [Brenneria roseae]PWC14393.1 ABC transporter ATP-binding protein [Brenneria roseae subsp. americana]
MIEPLLTVKNLRKTFRVGRGWRKKSVVALDNVSFHIFPGETYALVGESGSGKSTTGRSILGLTPANAGELHFAGQDLRRQSSAQRRQLRRDMQMIFQDPLSSLDPKRSVGYSIEEPLIIHGIRDGQWRKEQVAKILTRVGFTPADAGRFPHEFSGGQRQRIGIARALVLQPKLIVCDEPVSALDVSIQSQILNLLLALQREQGVAYLFISHDLSVVYHLADRIGVMYRGRIVEEAPAETLFSQARHPYTRLLLASIPPAHPWLKQTAAQVEQKEIADSGCQFDVPASGAEARCRVHHAQEFWVSEHHRVACTPR